MTQTTTKEERLAEVSNLIDDILKAIMKPHSLGIAYARKEARASAQKLYAYIEKQL